MFGFTLYEFRRKKLYNVIVITTCIAEPYQFKYLTWRRKVRYFALRERAQQKHHLLSLPKISASFCCSVVIALFSSW